MSYTSGIDYYRRTGMKEPLVALPYNEIGQGIRYLTPQQIADQELADSRKSEYKRQMADVDTRLKLVSENFNEAEVEAANTISKKLCKKVTNRYVDPFKKDHIFLVYSKREFHKLDVPRFIASVYNADQMTESDRRNYIARRKKEFYNLIILMVRVQLKNTKPDYIHLDVTECDDKSENYLTVEIRKVRKGWADRDGYLNLV